MPNFHSLPATRDNKAGMRREASQRNAGDCRAGILDCWSSRRRKEAEGATNSIPPAYEQGPKRHRAAALHDLAEGVACNLSRQRLGVRQPYAALNSIRRESRTSFNAHNDHERCCGWSPIQPRSDADGSARKINPPPHIGSYTKEMFNQ
jgi:hypothetical protein